MKGIYRGSLSAINWHDLYAVIEVARQLATPTCHQVVVKHLNRTNYNICFESRPETYADAKVEWNSRYTEAVWP
jgi:hypothetical protein